jgi:two-component system nitrogen regulation response regulator GlnG
MSLPTQAKILRVLQNGTFERVGGNQAIKVDVRVIAATHRPLEKAVEDRTFREDLFYRLNVVRVRVPTLRERRDDVPLLVSYFLKKFGAEQKKNPKAISEKTLALLQEFHWPGNVRELENIIERATVVAKGEVILPSDLPVEISKAQTATVTVSATTVQPGGAPDFTSISKTLFSWARENSKLKVLPAVERELIIQALTETKGNQVQAAKILGITRATLRKRIEKFQIKQELAVK